MKTADNLSMEQDSDYSDFVKKLIGAVRKQACIYDKKHISYFNKFEREKAWSDVAEQLDRSVDDCQKRWKLLREKLAKELKKRDRALACGQDFRSDWACFEKIVFIEDHIAPRKKLDNRPYFFVPVECREQFLHPASDSNQSNTSLSHESEQHSQQKPLVLQQHHQQQQPIHSQQPGSINYNNTHYQHSVKRFCQRISNRSSSLDFGLPYNKNFTTDRNSNNTSSNYNFLSNYNTNRQIKEEPNEMIEIDELADERDSMYDLEMMNRQQPSALVTPGHSVTASVELFSNGQVAGHQQQQIHDNHVDQTTGILPPSSSTSTYTTQRTSMPDKSQMNTRIDEVTKHSMLEDSDSLFGKMVTAMLKDISVEENKDNVKLHIMQMLIKAKRGDLK